MPTVVILGRQPELGLAELESLYGPERLRPLQHEAALLDIPAEELPFERLGGSVKAGSVLARLNTANWGSIEAALIKAAAQYASKAPDGKLTIGISVHGLPVKADRLGASGLKIKKALKAEGRSVRVVPNKSFALNTAQVLHNNMTSPTGCELLVVVSGDHVTIARTTAVQNIDAYTKRDRGRPMRDAKVGMLPPKLAQIVINLATGHPAEAKSTPATTVQPRILDPFCGTGVVLQEAALMGYAVYGTDLEERMVRYSRDNLNWLHDSHRVSFDWYVEPGDATRHTWQKPIDAVVCETYLGRPLASLPDSGTLDKNIRFCNDLHLGFLRNLSGQLAPGTRLCLAVPSWQIGPRRFKKLPVLDDLAKLGYNQLSFVHAGNRELIYARPDQIVARELVIATKQ